MTKNEALKLALEAGAAMIHGGEHALMGDFALQTFFKKAYAAGAAAEREKEKERQRYDIHSCGPDCDRYICVAVRKAREEEREACAKVCDDKANHCETKAQEAIELGEHDEVSAIRSTAWQISVCAAAIRARGQQ